MSTLIMPQNPALQRFLPCWHIGGGFGGECMQGNCTGSLSFFLSTPKHHMEHSACWLAGSHSWCKLAGPAMKNCLGDEEASTGCSAALGTATPVGHCGYCTQKIFRPCYLRQRPKSVYFWQVGVFETYISVGNYESSCFGEFNVSIWG